MKAACITGASRGIGAAIARKLASEGYHLALMARGDEALTRLSRELQDNHHIVCMALAGDVSSADFVADAFDQVKCRLGQIDALVNNAGIAHIRLLSEVRVEEWNQILNVNLTSAFLCCRQAIPMMVSRKCGRILNISSVWGEVGASCEAAYSAAKAGLNGLTRALGKELAPSNIAVNAIACGMVDTDMNRSFSQQEREALLQEIPAGRFAAPEEVAQLAYALLNAPTYLTGQVISMDGGWI